MALCKPFLLGMASVLKKNLGQAIIPAVLRTTPWLIWILFAGTVAFSISVSALDVVWKGSILAGAILAVVACILTKVCCAPLGEAQSQDAARLAEASAALAAGEAFWKEQMRRLKLGARAESPRPGHWIAGWGLPERRGRENQPLRWQLPPKPGPLLLPSSEPEPASDAPVLLGRKPKGPQRLPRTPRRTAATQEEACPGTDSLEVIGSKMAASMPEALSGLGFGYQVLRCPRGGVGSHEDRTGIPSQQQQSG
ncbi:unnamed protein product [Effrenium voratum]|nr:unnamed protein product [Effrenium voratum]